MDRVVLLGAGASAEAGVPTSFEMSKRLRDEFRDDRSITRLADVLDFVIGSLVQERGMQGLNPYDGVDVERLFAAVRLLADRQASEAFPFVGSWHPRVADLDRAGPEANRIAEEFLNDYAEQSGMSTGILGRGFPRWFSFGGIVHVDHITVQSFQEAVRAQLSASRPGTVFQQAAAEMLRRLIRIVWIQDRSKTEYLEPLANAARAGPMVIASLNYDNALELAALKAEVKLDRQPRTLLARRRHHSEGIRLLKLHGSIDWTLTRPKDTPTGPLNQRTLEFVDPAEAIADNRMYDPAVIFGQGNKLTAHGPFLQLFMEFQESLARVSNFVLIGYSFRDLHINESIRTWLNSDKQRRLTVVNRSENWKESEFGRELATNAGDMVNVIPAPASEAILQLFG
jgi:hypothetical protein